MHAACCSEKPTPICVKPNVRRKRHLTLPDTIPSTQARAKGNSTMHDRRTSRDNDPRLTEQTPTGRPPSTYVANVRESMANMRDSGSQHHRTKYGNGEGWPVMQDRWI